MDSSLLLAFSGGEFVYPPFLSIPWSIPPSLLSPSNGQALGISSKAQRRSSFEHAIHSWPADLLPRHADSHSRRSTRLPPPLPHEQPSFAHSVAAVFQPPAASCSRSTKSPPSARKHCPPGCCWNTPSEQLPDNSPQWPLPPRFNGRHTRSVPNRSSLPKQKPETAEHRGTSQGHPRGTRA